MTRIWMDEDTWPEVSATPSPIVETAVLKYISTMLRNVVDAVRMGRDGARRLSTDMTEYGRGYVNGWCDALVVAQLAAFELSAEVARDE